MKGGLSVSSMDKMWLSFYAMGFMVISMGLIYTSRYKINNRLIKFVLALIAYVLLILSFIALIYLVFNGPTGRSMNLLMKKMTFLLCLSLTIILTGCMYPEDNDVGSIYSIRRSA